ncbi:MAG: hypothetical protein PHQ28_14100 [Mycobacterium sp.]|nr:hypothetical protein [Mycobacterium sp.]
MIHPDKLRSLAEWASYALDSEITDRQPVAEHMIDELRAMADDAPEVTWPPRPTFGGMVPRYPIGTPEYAAYRQELAGELDRWKHGE